jgi:hypothetical protein
MICNLSLAYAMLSTDPRLREVLPYHHARDGMGYPILLGGAYGNARYTTDRKGAFQ